VNRAITSGDISASLPFVKKKSMELLMAQYANQEEASRKIVEQLRNYYRSSHPDVAAQLTSEFSGHSTWCKLQSQLIHP
jgi:hypothetical protein